MGKIRINKTGKCLVCGIKLIPKIWKCNPIRTAIRVQCSLYCSSHCKWLAEKEDYHKSKSWLKRKNLWKWRKERKCILCGKIFIPKKVCQKYCLDKCNARKAWKKRNWDYVLSKNREYLKKRRQKNPERERQKVKEWKKQNPDYVKWVAREYGRLRKHRIRANGGNLTLKEWEDIKEKQNYCCKICGKRKKLTIDHKIPISKGGKHEKRNIQALCIDCNLQKGNRVNFIPHTSISPVS